MSINFKKVNNENYKDILNLKVASGQENFIETTAQCLKEAEELSLWNPVGIYDDEKLVGFAMYGLFQDEGKDGRLWLDRFLIDKKYQGKGYGKKSLDLIIKKISLEFNKDEIFLSIYEENNLAVELYKRIGFKFNGELDINGEKVMSLKNI